MSKEIPEARLSYLPMQCGDGYNWGGGLLMTIGERSLMLAGSDPSKGYAPEDMEFAARLAEAWNAYRKEKPNG